MWKIVIIFFVCSTKLYANLNVDNYGAKGDGKTDDTNAIQNAINAASNDKIIFGRNKVYIVNSLYLEKKAGIVIEGNNATLKRKIQAEYTTYTNAGIICIFGSKNIIIKNLNFDGQRKLQKQKGFNMGVFIGGNKYNYTFFDNNYGENKINKNITISNCKFFNTGMYNEGLDKFGDGVYAHSTDSLTVKNNYFENMGRWGIACSESFNVLIEKNKVINNKESTALGGIDIENEGDDNTNGSYSRNITIRENNLIGKSAINIQTGISEKNKNGKYHYIKNVIISNNILDLINSGVYGKSGIFISEVDQQNKGVILDEIIIKNNILKSTDASMVNGIEFYLFGEKMTFSNIKIFGNELYSFQNGIVTNKSVVPIFRNVYIKDNKIISNGIGQNGDGIATIGAKYNNFVIENNYIEDYVNIGIQTLYNYPHQPNAEVKNNTIKFNKLKRKKNTIELDIMDLM